MTAASVTAMTTVTTVTTVMATTRYVLLLFFCARASAAIYFRFFASKSDLAAYMAVHKELCGVFLATQQLEREHINLSRRVNASQKRFKEVFIRRASMQERSPGLRVSWRHIIEPFHLFLRISAVCMSAHSYLVLSLSIYTQEAVWRVEQGAVLAETPLPVGGYVVRPCR